MEHALELGDGSGLELDEILWTTQAAPARWLRETGLALDDKGFVRVAATLESLSHAGVFAAGDMASVEGHDLPKSGVYAVREGRRWRTISAKRSSPAVRSGPTSRSATRSI